MAGINVHIPFCASRCSYCDFYSTLRMNEVGEIYVESLISEAQLRYSELGDDHVKTLYLGGGTPSQLPVSLLSCLLNGLGKVFDLSGLEECTVEANPDDVTPDWCAALQSLGVNRVSMGVQSFEDKILRNIGRRHTASQVVKAISQLRKAGISNISIDLIYGLPGQTLASWTDTVKKTIGLEPCHISAYGLTYEPSTRLWHQRERGEVIEVPEEQCLEMHRILVERLKGAGYERYEISNFALSGFRSRHNSSYWNDTSYLGLGAAAHSYDGQVRRVNPPDLAGYIAALQAGKTCFDEERMTLWERYDERVMLGLRTSDGVYAERLRKDFGEEAWRHFVRETQPHLDNGNLALLDNDRYVLTDKGIMLSDTVIRDLMWDI